MAISGTNIGTGGDDTSATNTVISPPTNCTALATVVLAIEYDNAGTNGADPYNSISDSHGNTWTPRQNALRDPGAANAGIVTRIFTTSQNIATLTTGSTITVDFGAFSVERKAWTITEFTAAGDIEYVTGGTETGLASSNSIVTGSITSGNAVFVAQGSEIQTVADRAGDSDTTNGNWSSTQFANDGVPVGGIMTQFKIVTATATQDHTGVFYTSSTDFAAAWIELTEISTFTPQDPFGQFGFFGI